MSRTARERRAPKLRLVSTGAASASTAAAAVQAATPEPSTVDLAPPPSAAAPDSTPSTALEALDDAALVAMARSGDRRACEQLYRRHASFAFNVATRIAGSTADVEDVAHDAFLRAFDNLDTLRKPAAFRSWLGSIVVHMMRSRLRRGKLLRLFGLGRRNDPVDLDSLVNEGASPRVRAELAQVYALLGTLSADDRIAWTLRYVEGHDLNTTAVMCDCSLATVKRRIRRAQSYIEAHFVDATEREATSTGAPRLAKRRTP
jgi:RNA polymerase sigma-70 factor (ECF subfamily)